MILLNKDKNKCTLRTYQIIFAAISLICLFLEYIDFAFFGMEIIAFEVIARVCAVVALVLSIKGKSVPDQH